jgi:hypothetical protein
MSTIPGVGDAGYETGRRVVGAWCPTAWGCPCAARTGALEDTTTAAVIAAPASKRVIVPAMTIPARRR